MMKKGVAMLCLLALIAALFASCVDDSAGSLSELDTTVKNTQVFTDTGEEGTTALMSSGGTGTPILIDESWLSNYTLSYTYEENGQISDLTEHRCEGVYTAKEGSSGAMTCFLQNGENVDEYALNPANKTGTHMVLSNQSLSSITPGFLKIARVDAAFPTLSNVEFQGEESVAGRPAKKYAQSAYNSAGLLTAYAFVWIDDEYGFASKCRVYNLTGSVNVSWELKSLTVGGVTEESIGFSTDGYEITEQEANAS